MISASQIQVTFADQQPAVLDQLDLEVERGEFVTVLGPSGCGKSTLLRLIAGLQPLTSGRLDVGEPGEPPQLGFVFQDPTLLPWRTVLDNIRLPLELQRQPLEQQLQAARQSLQLIGLSEDDALKYPRMLSGGMRMRVSLARSLVTEPDLLLLDEPFAALDEILRQQLNEELLAVWQERQQTIVFVTHNVSEAVFLSQRVCLMQATPGLIVDEIEIPFRYPRESTLRGEPEFGAMVQQVSTRLRELVT